MIVNEIAPVLSHIFNRFLLSGIVPSQLKIVKVNPIFKSGDNQVFSNYIIGHLYITFNFKNSWKIMYIRLFDFVTKMKF